MPVALMWIIFIITAATSVTTGTITIVKLLQSKASPEDKAFGVLQVAANNFIGLLSLPNSPIPAGAAAQATAWGQMATQALNAAKVGIDAASANTLIRQVGDAHGFTAPIGRPPEPVK